MRSVSPRFAAGSAVTAGFLALALLLLVLLAVGTRDLIAVTEHEQSIAQTHLFLSQLEDALSLGVSSESAARGFVLTGDERWLAPHNDATRRMAPTLDALLRMAERDPAQQARLRQLSASLTHRLELSNQFIETRRIRGFDAARDVLAAGHGKREMDRARGIKAEIEQAESNLLSERIARATASLRTARLTLLGAALGGLFAIVWLAAGTERAARTRLEAARWLRYEKERFETTLLSIGDAVVVTDAHAVITFINAVGERLTGWTAGDAVGRRLNDVFHIVNETTGERVNNPVDRVIAEGTVQGLANHTVLVARSGTRCPIDDSAAPIFGSDGRLAGVVLVFRDVTEQRETAARIEAQNRALLQASRDKDDFVAQVSHELRTPINAILGWAKMLASGSVRPERQAHAIDVIVQNALMQARLLDDLIDLARIVRGTISLDLDRIHDVGPIALAAVDTMKVAATAKGVRIDTRIAASGAVHGDAARLQQVIWNLVSNAVKFTPSGGVVTVEVGCTDTDCTVTVSDTGIGMDADTLRVIFGRFTQGDSGGKHRQGLGLGLAIAKELVQLHGGTIDAKSDGPGTGATFTVTLPLATATDVVRSS